MDIPMTNTAVITFGRMNPITAGHEMLVNKVKRMAHIANATPLVYLSHSHDDSKNPIPYITKVNLAMQAFGKCVQISDAKNIIEVLINLSGKYDKMIVMVGSDRVSEFTNLLNKYNGVDYHYNSITVVSAGTRDDSDDGIAGISASKLRECAVNKDYASFKKSIPATLQPYHMLVAHLVRKGLNYEN